MKQRRNRTESNYRRAKVNSWCRLLEKDFDWDYVFLLERAHREAHDFIEFIAERELESQKEILRLFQIPFPKMESGMSGMELK